MDDRVAEIRGEGEAELLVRRRGAASLAALVVGTMNFGRRTDERESQACIERALALGVRAFDTANLYADGLSEAILGRVLEGSRSVQVATKVGLRLIDGRPEGLAPERVLEAVDGSLARLRRDTVDLLYLHAPDRRVPVDETLGAVRDLVRAGKVRHLGVSNYASWEVLEIALACDRMGLERPRATQVVMNVAIRLVEAEHLRFAAKYGLHVTAYNPLAGGLFARALDPSRPEPGTRFALHAHYARRYGSPRFTALSEAIRAIASRHGTTPAAVAYGWLAAHAGVDSVIAGPSRRAHVEAAVEALSKAVAPELLAEVAEAQRAFDDTDATYAR
jgi:aryl-alcohol dehydrogenase-like predicted oxidoreductase